MGWGDHWNMLPNRFRPMTNGRIQQDTFVGSLAGRPLPSQRYQGYRYIATDAGAYVCDGTNWIFESAGFSGDFTISNAGVATIAADAVTNLKLATMPATTIKGNPFGSSNQPIDMSALQAGQLIGGNTKNVILPRGFIDGLILANNAGPSQSLKINPGCARDSLNATDLGVTSAYFKTLAGTWVAGAGSTGSPVNGLDTGTVAASTWYHLWIIGTAEGGTIDFLFSLSATAPTLPVFYSFKRRIGAVLTDGTSKIIAFHQVGDYFYWDVPAADANGAPLGATVVNLTVSTPLGVITQVFGTINITNATVGSPVRAWSPQQGGTQPANTGIAEVQVTNVNQNASTPPIATNTSSQINWNAAASSTCGWLTWGWIDPRGKNDTANV